MKGKIMILSLRKGKEYTCIHYLLLNNESVLNNERAIGFVDVSSFTKLDIIGSIKTDDCLQVIDCTFRNMQDFKNPLNTRLVLESLTLKNGKVINLL